MMMAASCPKPDSEVSGHSLAAFDENKQQALEHFYFLSKYFFESKNGDLTTPRFTTLVVGSYALFLSSPKV